MTPPLRTLWRHARLATMADPSGDPQRYGALPSSRVRREVLGALADWAVRVGGR